MSRIRTIKPEFWSSEQTMDCSPIARLLFIGLWNFCDDNGIHPASPKRIKAEVFPGDNCSTADIIQWMNELIQNNLIQEYIAENKAYWIVTGWKKHQKIEKPTYRHPLPQSELKVIADHSMINQRKEDESLPNDRPSLDELSPTEWNGVEGNGKEINICEVETSPVDDFKSNSSASTQELFNYWQAAMNHPCARLDLKRQRAIEKAMKLGYSIEELKRAIDGCSKTPYNMGKNDTNQIYDDISLIFRDADHIERFMNNANGGNTTHGHHDVDDLMAGVI